jgi:hypothetical protein
VDRIVSRPARYLIVTALALAASVWIWVEGGTLWGLASVITVLTVAAMLYVFDGEDHLEDERARAERARAVGSRD